MIFSVYFFFLNDTATTEIYTLSLHDALPISHAATFFKGWPPSAAPACWPRVPPAPSHRPASRQRGPPSPSARSEEHTSELQSPCNLVCRLLLEKKKNKRLDTSSLAVRSYSMK